MGITSTGNKECSGQAQISGWVEEEIRIRKEAIIKKKTGLIKKKKIAIRAETEKESGKLSKQEKVRLRET